MNSTLTAYNIGWTLGLLLSLYGAYWLAKNKGNKGWARLLIFALSFMFSSAIIEFLPVTAGWSIGVALLVYIIFVYYHPNTPAPKK